MNFEDFYKYDQIHTNFFFNISGVHSQAPVECLICKKSFNTEKRMRKHLLNSHKEQAPEFQNAWKSTEPFQTITIKFNQV